MKNERILNIYGQEDCHTEATIVASRDALEALKKAIDHAIYYGYAGLGGGKDEKGALYASDGEGYLLQINCLGGWDDKRWQFWTPVYNMLIRALGLRRHKEGDHGEQRVDSQSG